MLNWEFSHNINYSFEITARTKLVKFLWKKENNLPLPPKLKILFTKNTINAELRIDGDFYPCTF
jgi:hypothetical protein